jgi:hypothetical protein
VGISGSLKTMPAGDLLEWAARRDRRGELTVERGDMTRKLLVGDGKITGTSSNNPAEYLGQLLLNSRLITENTLREAHASLGSGLSLGMILMARGLREDALRTALETKVREGLFDLLSWTDGLFSFNDEAPPVPGVEYEIAMPIPTLLAEAASRVAEWIRIRAQIPDDSTRFFLLPEARHWPATPILRDVGRGMSVRELMLEHHSLPFPMYQELEELLTRGLIRTDRRVAKRLASDRQLPPAEQMLAARGRARGGDKTGALVMARQALQAAPNDEGLKGAYAAIERQVFAELSRTLLSRYRVPKLLKSQEELAGEELTAEERYFVGRIDGRWDLLSLMRVSPLREVEALLTLQQLATRGVISLE